VGETYVTRYSTERKGATAIGDLAGKGHCTGVEFSLHVDPASFFGLDLCL